MLSSQTYSCSSVIFILGSEWIWLCSVKERRELKGVKGSDALHTECGSRIGVRSKKKIVITEKLIFIDLYTAPMRFCFYGDGK